MTRQLSGWRPGEWLTTPHTCLNWGTLAEWLAAWHQLHRS